MQIGNSLIHRLAERCPGALLESKQGGYTRASLAFGELFLSSARQLWPGWLTTPGNNASYFLPIGFRANAIPVTARDRGLSAGCATLKG